MTIENHVLNDQLPDDEIATPVNPRKHLAEMFAGYEANYLVTAETLTWINAPAVGAEIR